MNRSRHLIFGAMFIAAVMSSLPLAHAANQEAGEISDEDVAELVEKVASGSPVARIEAGDKLVELGERAVAPLAVKADTNNAEESFFCMEILTRLGRSSDANVAKAASDSLELLAKSKDEGVARRAKTALRIKDFLRQRAAAAARPVVPAPNINARINVGLQFNGNANGMRQIQVTRGDEKIEISDANGKDIRVKHTRNVDGKAKTDEYSGTDLDDLKKKHPEAAKLYESTVVGQAIPVGAANAIQIQVGAGQAKVLQAAAPVPIVGGIQFAAQPEISPGFPEGPRTIRAERDGVKYEIRDEDGMRIRVKIARTIDGKENSQEYEAQDLSTLNIRHPEIARVYEQFTGRSLK